METHNEKDSFSYTYSAKQRDEVKNIRDKYLPREEDNFEKLVRLDRSVTQKSMAVSLSVGVVGTLILGLGMSMAMVFGEGDMVIFIAGIIVGILGLGIAGIAYPLYSFITRKEKERIAPEIIRLTEELLK